MNRKVTTRKQERPGRMAEINLITVVGARPNIVKIAPLVEAIKEHNEQRGDVRIANIIVHTGQHYDSRMSQAFFDSLKVPEPDIHLGVGSGTHAEQVGKTMMEFEKVITRRAADWVVLVGDVNATLACSVTAKKELVKVCHVEAGLRSGDMAMPEEINRIVTDRLSDLLLTPDRMSSENLRREGVPENRIRFIGNVMIDTLEANRKHADDHDINEVIEKNRITEETRYRITEQGYVLLTLHRPSNVDERDIFGSIVDYLLDEVSREQPVVWPVHPRARKQLEKFGLWNRLAESSRIAVIQPVDYHEMLRLTMSADIVMTDSGGVQEECCVLGIPCLTMRWNTERPITLTKFGGVSELVGNDVGLIRETYRKMRTRERTISRPELWDGKSAGRAVRELVNYEDHVK